LVATYWRLSKTLATQSGLRRAEVASATQAGMTNQWLAEQGLVSIKPKRSEIESDEKRARKRRPRQTLWVAFHYPPNAAKG
jgi:hypothetical protein